MKTATKLFKSHLLFSTLFLLISFIVLPAVSFGAVMEDYCLVPPYVKRDVIPNVMIIMDNAENMENRAYAGAYDKTVKYNGYYNPSLMYYNGSNIWVPAASRPAGCTTPGCVYMSGNLLNWATTSKFDLLEKILVGGKGIATNCQNSTKLDGRSNDWFTVLTYVDGSSQTRICYFYMSNNKLQIKDAPAAGGSCGYLDNPAKPIPIDPLFSTLDTGTRFVENTVQEEKAEKKSLLSKILYGILDFLVPSAEAAAPLAIESPNAFNNSATECTPYSYTFSATNGTAPYTWRLGTAVGGFGCGAGYPLSGTTDTGLCLITSASTGILSGTPKVSGNFALTVTVTDSVGATDSQSYTSSGSKWLMISPVTLSITSASPLSSGPDSIYYSNTLATNSVCSSGGYTWNITGQTAGTNGCGALAFPISGTNSGLCLDSISGQIAGIPTGDGPYPKTYNFTANVTGYAGKTASKAFSLTITALPPTVTIITPSPLPSATKDSAYTTVIEAVSGTTPYIGWSIVGQADGTYGCAAGTFPLVASNIGLCLDPAPAAYLPNKQKVNISGTPTVVGTYTFTVQVTGGGGTTDSRVYTLTVLAVSVRQSTAATVSVCLGDYVSNCESAGSPEFYTGGLLQNIWTDARFGLITFAQASGGPVLNECIDVSHPAVMPSNFCAAVRTATASSATTALVDGEWVNVNYFANENSGSGGCQNPFNGTSSCAKNFNLIISAGLGANTKIDAAKVYSAANGYTVPSDCTDTDYKDLTKNTCFGFNTDIRNSPTFGGTNMGGKQNVHTYIVNTMGDTMSSTTYDPDDPTSTTGDILFQAATKGDGVYYEVIDAEDLEATLAQAFQDILKRAASGTAASVLASGEGSGANLIQAVFYPIRKFNNTEISWIGRLTNLWYYVDPRFGSSSIFEDNASTRKLNLTDDYKIVLQYNNTLERTEASRTVDTDGDGVYTTTGITTPVVEFEKLNGLWEAGLELWKRDISASKRKIYTTLNGTQFLAGNFSQDALNGDSDNAATLLPYFNLTQAADDLDGDTVINEVDDARRLIRYLHGEDFSGLRGRSVQVDLNNDGDYGDTIGGIVEANPRVWKLGDILNSTPKISSWAQLNLYYKNHQDTTYRDYVASNIYKTRGMVFAGGNDGMLHAFKLGTLDVSGALITGSTKAALCNDANSDRECTDAEVTAATDIGKEVWAFIPKNVLPYLKYLPKNDYCHLYSVDLTPYILDASINKPGGCVTNYWDCDKTVDSWKTILIGGMRYGGACRNNGVACNTTTGGLPDCVNTPIANNGYSSYFALDITDQNNPVLLWEFSSPELGFSTTGPVVAKINARKPNAGNTASEQWPKNTKNDKWFVVIGSGPTGPIDSSNEQFMGRSDQNLKVFILDLAGPGAGNPWVLDTNYWKKDSGKTNAFSGSVLASTIDTDYDFEDNVMYIPYVKRDDATGPNYTWTKGGVLRLSTKEEITTLPLTSTALYPSNWELSSLMENIGPVTSAVVQLQNRLKGQLWTYFGEGRYYFENSTSVDDADGQRRLYGIKEPCYTSSGFNGTCTTTRAFGDLTDVTNINNAPTNPDLSTYYGWFIDLDPTAGAFKAERVISNPFAITSGVAFFSTYKPYSDVCAYGGNTNLWAIRYNTGGAPGSLQGLVLLQSSTGSIEQLDLSTLTGRRFPNIEGKPPEGGPPPLLTTPPALKKVIHTRER